MSYSQFTIDKVKQAFELTTVEGKRFFPPVEQILSFLVWMVR